MIWKAARDEALPVYGAGLNVRDWLYVEAQHGRPSGPYFRRRPTAPSTTSAGTNEWRNLEVVKLLLREMGKPESLIRFRARPPGTRPALCHRRLAPRARAGLAASLHLEKSWPTPSAGIWTTRPGPTPCDAGWPCKEWTNHDKVSTCDALLALVGWLGWAASASALDLKDLEKSWPDPAAARQPGPRRPPGCWRDHRRGRRTAWARATT